MKFNKQGNFWIPEGFALEDLGGKAEQLIRNQNAIVSEGFKLPEAVCIPWQAFISVAVDNGVDVKNFKCSYDDRIYFDIKKTNFNEEQNEILNFVLGKLNQPYYSSSAPGEDSLKTRMPGVYNSHLSLSIDEAINAAKTLLADDLKDFGIKGKTLQEKADEYRKFQSRNLIKCVIESYYSLLGSSMSQKHDIPEKGMSILAREAVKSKQNDSPDHSLVVHTGYGDEILLSIAEGFGTNIVNPSLKKRGKIGTYFYDKNKKSFELSDGRGFFSTRTNKLGDIDLANVVEKLLSLEEKLSYPDGYAVDYEISIADNEIYLLQCPPIKKVQMPQMNDSEKNLFYRVDEVLGAGKKQIDTMFIIPDFAWQENKAREELLRELFYYNKNNTNFIILGSPEISHRSYMPEHCYFNAAAIIEDISLTGETSTRHLGKGVSHYSNFLRSEGISYIYGQLNAHFMNKYDLHAILDEDKYSHKIIPVDMALETNEKTQQARLYFNGGK